MSSEMRRKFALLIELAIRFCRSRKSSPRDAVLAAKCSKQASAMQRTDFIIVFVSESTTKDSTSKVCCLDMKLAQP